MHPNLYQRLKYSDSRSFGGASRAVSLLQLGLSAWRNCNQAFKLACALILYVLAYAILSGMFIFAITAFAAASERVVGESAAALFDAGSSLGEFAISSIASAQVAPTTAIEGVLTDALLWVLLIGASVLLCASLPLALVSVLTLLSRFLIILSKGCLVLVLAISILVLWITAYTSTGALQLTLHRRFPRLAQLESHLRDDLRFLVHADNSRMR